MIGYLDTSAFVPLLIEEPTSQTGRRFWDDADVIVSSQLLYVETAAALAQARGSGASARASISRHVGVSTRCGQRWMSLRWMSRSRPVRLT